MVLDDTQSVIILRRGDGARPVDASWVLGTAWGVGRPEARADRKVWGDMDSRNLHLGYRCGLCLLALAASLLFGILFVGCGPATYPSLPTGRLKVVLGKTPTPSEPLKQATMTVTRVEVLRKRAPLDHAATAGMYTLPQSAEPANDSWIVVQQREEILDLLEIQGGNTSIFINADIPEGRYVGLRLTCREGCVTVDQSSTGQTAETFVVQVAREKAREVTLDCDFVVTTGRETALLLNVDVNRAFQPIRGSGVKHDEPIKGFHFVPRPAIRLVNLLSAGPIMSATDAQAGRRDFDPT